MAVDPKAQPAVQPPKPAAPQAHGAVDPSPIIAEATKILKDAVAQLPKTVQGL